MKETIPSLILEAKGGRSYDRLARDCGGSPNAKRLHAMATSPMKSFPDPETLERLARGLNMPVTRLVLAAARSLGLPVSAGDDDLVLYGAGRLPSDSKELLTSMARQLVNAHDMTVTHAS